VVCSVKSLGNTKSTGGGAWCVIPIVPRGNTQSAVYAIAERAADLIKENLTGGE
jgi:choline dehydrogenase-like flavoprotein